MTRQTKVEEVEEIFASVESPPPSKRRKSARGVSYSDPNFPHDSSQNAIPPSSESVVKDKTPSKRKSRRVTTNPKPRESTATTEPAHIETIDETTSTPISNRRATRSALTLPPTENPSVEITKEKAPRKPKSKHSRNKSRKVSALSKIVSEIDNPCRRSSRSTQSLEELPVESIQSEPDTIPEILEEETILPKKRRSRPAKIRELDDGENQESATPARRTRQTIASQPFDFEIIEEEAHAKPPKELVIPKRKRTSARATRTTSAAVAALPEIEEKEAEIVRSPRTRLSGRSVAILVVEVPEPTVESEPEPEPEEVVPAPRGKKSARGRGRSTTVRNSTITKPPDDVPETTGRRSRAASKRDISAVYHDMTDILSPPAKRKVSGLRSIQRIPTPSEDSASDIFEDSKSTFSDVEDVVPSKPIRAARRTLKSRSKIVTSEERETENAPSTIYHSADDYQLSPTQSSVMGKSKREMVDNAKKELQEEIWREKVANGEVGVGGSSEDDEKENAAEEKGKKPTRTVRGKGSKGRKNKVNGKKGGKIVEISDDDVESVGESHALVVKAMISPLRPGPLIAEATSEESSEEEHMENGQATPILSPKRKVLNWTPAKIEEVSPTPMVNGSLAEEEEDMTVEQWMRWVINDEVNRLEEECEKLVRNLEKEGDRARRLLENLA